MTGERTASSFPFPLDKRLYSERVRTFMPSTTDALNQAVDVCLRVAGTCGFDEDERTDLEIALREALANAIIHGNGRRAGTRFFLRCYAGTDAGLLVLVRDQGAGFDPGDVPDPRHGERVHLHHGRGLFLMKRLMNHVVYRRGGREILLFKTPEA